MRHLPSLFLLLFLLPMAREQAQAQSCSQILRLARATYEQGRLHELAALFEGKNCFTAPPESGGLTKAEKVEAYRLLTLTYIYLEEPEKADETMVALKKTDPYYEPNTQIDPAEFIALYNTFRKEPIYRVGFIFGGNFSRPSVADQNAAVPLSDGSRYRPLFAIQFGGTLDIPLTERFTLHTDLLFQQHRFSIQKNVDRGENESGEFLRNELTAVESQSWLSLPVLLEYSYLSPASQTHKRLRPYIGLGINPAYRLGSSISPQRLRDQASSVPEASIAVERSNLNLSATVSTGVKLRVGGGLLVGEVRYIHGFTSLTSADTAFQNERLLWNYGYADPIFRISSFNITASYILDIFKPKKIRPSR